jgi:hypothetical protein
MRTHTVIAFILLWAAAASVLAQPLDVSKIRRTINKESDYQSKAPKYCLLVFGPEAKNRVWLVIDGDRLFIDRKGKGDLTNDEKFERKKGGYFSGMGALQPGDAEPEYELDLVVPTGGSVAAFRDAHNVESRIGERLIQTGSCVFADTPNKAPVLWFDGPLTVGLAEPDKTSLTRGGHATELYLWVGTPTDPRKQKGTDPVVRVSHSVGVPEDIHPEAELEYPSKKRVLPRIPGRAFE